MDRRAFIRGALRTAAAVAAGRRRPRPPRAAPRAGTSTCVVAGGTVYDGSGGPPFQGGHRHRRTAPIRAIGRIRALAGQGRDRRRRPGRLARLHRRPRPHRHRPCSSIPGPRAPSGRA
ncbi:MAG: hypothetical protein M0C28_38670 [Candidatus Moduliflexus flocculans]|nr:hypothetical protein [Candidatus Moduliflexus flocculans]